MIAFIIGCVALAIFVYFQTRNAQSNRVAFAQIVAAHDRELRQILDEGPGGPHDPFLPLGNSRGG